MKVLVTGGAGYIGAVCTAHLLERGDEVTVLDDLSTGHAQAIPPAARFVRGRVQDADTLDLALDGNEAVIHFASRSLVGESVTEPLLYFRENVGSALALLDGMQRHDIRKIVFSSSAAVYGNAQVDVIDEAQPLSPVNPYGHSKAMVERVLQEQSRAKGIGAVCLRYFNACGADGTRGEDHRPETHLIPRVCLHVLGRLAEFSVYGGDHPTADGTAVRDYVHVKDLATAHAAALGAMQPDSFEAINLGTGHGASVAQVLKVVASISGVELDAPRGPRRAGDPARLVASNEMAQRRLAWKPRHSDLATVVGDALRWHREHPHGYGA